MKSYPSLCQLDVFEESYHFDVKDLLRTIYCSLTGGFCNILSCSITTNALFVMLEVTCYVVIAVPGPIISSALILLSRYFSSYLRGLALIAVICLIVLELR